VAHLDRARAEAELAALKSQIDPHFLFNGLNSLAYLIPREPARAVEFTKRLSDVYRYILLNRERDLVPLREELAFALRYVGLLRIRFGERVHLRAAEILDQEAWSIPPVSLQVLLENAVKHNAIDAEAPLEIRIARGPSGIEVSNSVRRPRIVRPSPRVGLANLDERCRRITGHGIEVRAEEGRFTVVLPLVPA
jgi:LytS/YehU family sensor histidine kinase